MKIFILFLFILSFCFSKEYIDFGKFKDDNSIFLEKNISKLTEKFLDTKYVSNTLSNDQIDTNHENLIINFNSIDCFTFIDTIEALKQSDNKKEFKSNLIHTRYKNGDISYFQRNHFFSDWLLNSNIKDITCSLGNCNRSKKYLNKEYKYLKGIPEVIREIKFIDPKKLDTSKLKNGDYVGIYTTKKDLDVTHTGIIIKKDDQVFIRHASSLKKKIIDSEFFTYTKDKIGVIIYRSF